MNTTITGKTPEKFALKIVVASVLALMHVSELSAKVASSNDSLTNTATIVNTGFLKKKKEIITQSVDAVYSNQLQQSSVSNNGLALMGRIPGLTVYQPTTEPGYVESKMYIRGLSTYTNAAPLILVDGFEADFSAIGIREIESISVSKDAASTAMFGLKGANGVIMITTKRGSAGKPRFKVSVEGGFSNVSKKPAVLNAGEYTRLYNKALEMDGLDPLYDPSNYNGTSALYPDNDFFDQLIKVNAPLTMSNIELKGGTKAVRYFVNLGYLFQDGNFKHTTINDGYSTQSQLNRVNLRSNLDVSLTGNLSMNVDLGMRFENRNRPGIRVQDIMGSIFSTPPHLYNMINPDGSIGGKTDYRNNPYALITSTGYRKNHARDLFTTLRLNYDFSQLLQGLKSSAAVSVFDQSLTADNKTRSFAIYDLQTDSTYVKYGDNTNLSWTTGTSYFRRNNIEFNVCYERTLGKHELDFITLFRMSNVVRQATHHKPSNMGLSGQFSYSYNQRYLLDLSFAYHGSEIFAPGKRFGFFPAFSAGWIISQEDFLKDNEVINFVKIRASNGTSGSDMFITGLGVEDRIFYNQYYGNVGGYFFGEDASNARGGYGELRLANPVLTWEKSTKTDIGINTTLFNTLDIAFTYFNDKRTDIFTLDANAPAIIGINADRLPFTNNGEVQNKGYESVVGIHQKKGDFSWNINAILNYAKNKIVKKGDEPNYQYDNQKRIGKALGLPFGLQSIGLYDGKSSYTPHAWGQLREGDMVYNDINGDGIVNDNDITVIGYSFIPEYSFSLDLLLSYKNIDFSALVQGVENVSTFLGGLYMPFQNRMNALSNVYESWTPENKETATLPRLTTLNNPNNFRASTTWIKSSAFTKLRNIELGYNFGPRTLEELKLKNARLYFRGMNLFTLRSGIKEFDPETGLDNYPALRSVHIGFNVEF